MDSPGKRQPDPPRTSGVKPYSKPRLEVYGGLSELTATVSTRGNKDNPSPSHPAPNKTAL